MERAAIPEKDRKDFFLYADEFQNVATATIETILSEARKYKLNLIIAHQYIEQMEEEVEAAEAEQRVLLQLTVELVLLVPLAQEVEVSLQMVEEKVKTWLA